MIEHSIASALERLRRDIAGSNHEGNVEGLLARHILGDDVRLGFEWRVDCDNDWLASEYDPTRLPSVAALGYMAAHSVSADVDQSLQDGLARATGRDPAIAAQDVPLHSPAILVGLLLGSAALRSSHPECMAWCANVLKHLVAACGGRPDALLTYCASIAGIEVAPFVVDTTLPLITCAAADWYFDKPTGKSFASPEQRRELRNSIVTRSLTEESDSLPAHQAALLWRALQQAVGEETSELLQSPHTVVHLLQQFESCVRRWRWDSNALRNPVRWPILSEREVQDILWVMLRSVFVDLEDEDTLPKFGHSTYRADFGIPSIGVLIEVKFARSSGDFKDIEKEVLEDVTPYLKAPDRYREIVVFIYDDSASVQEHVLTERALASVQGIAGVVITSRPSQLPPCAEQMAKTKRLAEISAPKRSKIAPSEQP